MFTVHQTLFQPRKHLTHIQNISFIFNLCATITPNFFSALIMSPLSTYSCFCFPHLQKHCALLNWALVWLGLLYSATTDTTFNLTSFICTANVCSGGAVSVFSPLQIVDGVASTGPGAASVKHRPTEGTCEVVTPNVCMCVPVCVYFGGTISQHKGI